MSLMMTLDKTDQANDYAIACPAKSCGAEIGEPCREDGMPLVDGFGASIVHFGRRLKRVLAQTR